MLDDQIGLFTEGVRECLFAVAEKLSEQTTQRMNTAKILKLLNNTLIGLSKIGGNEPATLSDCSNFMVKSRMEKKIIQNLLHQVDCHCPVMQFYHHSTKEDI